MADPTMFDPDRLAESMARAGDLEKTLATELEATLAAFFGPHAATVHADGQLLLTWITTPPPDDCPSKELLLDEFSLTLQARAGREDAEDGLVERLSAALPWMRLIKERALLATRLLRLGQIQRLAHLGERVAGIAHELANPLQSVVSLGELLARRPNTQDAEAVGRRILSAALRCRAIVEDVLAFAHPGSSAQHAFSVHDAVLDALELDSLSTHHQVEVELESDDRHLRVHADSRRLTQVLMNLITNARHATRHAADSTILVQIQAISANAAQLRRAWGKPVVRISVSDHGHGVPEELRERIFEPFVTTKPSGEGTGLGLDLSRRYVREMGGDLTLDATYTTGARFVIEIPAHREDQTPLTATAQKSLRPATRCRILVIDDDRDMLETYGAILGLEGHEVIPCERGRDALAILQNLTVDVVLCDLRLPDLPGAQLLTLLKEHTPDVVRKVVFATGDIASEASRTFLKQAGRPVLAKPFQIDDLQRVIRTILDA